MLAYTKIKGRLIDVIHKKMKAGLNRPIMAIDGDK
jgi:hypothetical protein